MEAFSLLFGWGNFYSLELDFGFQGLFWILRGFSTV